MLSFDTDWRFDTTHSRAIVQRLEAARVPVTFREISSPWGHDSFLLGIDDYHRTVDAFLSRRQYENSRAIGAGADTPPSAQSATTPGRGTR